MSRKPTKADLEVELSKLGRVIAHLEAENRDMAKGRGPLLDQIRQLEQEKAWWKDKAEKEDARILRELTFWKALYEAEKRATETRDLPILQTMRRIEAHTRVLLRKPYALPDVLAGPGDEDNEDFEPPKRPSAKKWWQRIFGRWPESALDPEDQTGEIFYYGDDGTRDDWPADRPWSGQTKGEDR